MAKLERYTYAKSIQFDGFLVAHCKASIPNSDVDLVNPCTVRFFVYEGENYYRAYIIIGRFDFILELKYW